MTETISKNAYLQELGLPAGATPDQIQDAYRRQARLNHPDMHPGEEQYHERMLRINEARDALLAEPESSIGDSAAAWRAMSAELDRRDWILRQMCGNILRDEINHRLAAGIAAWLASRR